MREGRADFEGTYHAARGLQQNPVGPRPGKIPLLIGGNGPKGQRHAVRHADIWSGWIEDAVSVEEMGAKITSLEAICAEEGRDPATIGRSVGFVVDALAPSGARPDIVSGSPQEIADTFRAVQAVGYTRLEMMFRPATVEGIEALGRVLEAFDAG